MPTFRKLTERASNDPQRMKARKTEAEILAKMPPKAWLSCTAVSRLIGTPDDRKIRARLDRLVLDGKMERKREQGSHGAVYLFRIVQDGVSPPVSTATTPGGQLRVGHPRD